MTTEVKPKTNGNGQVSGKTKQRPTPKQLATPTDLEQEAVQAVSESVNGLIADSYALYLKTKNYHWHLASSHFRDYHLMFDEQADAIFESIDPLAERLRRIGGTTIRSVSHISDLQTIKDDNSDFVEADQMIANLLADNQQMARSLRAAIELTEDKKDFPTSNLLEEFLDETERRVWFLYEVSTGGRNER